MDSGFLRCFNYFSISIVCTHAHDSLTGFDWYNDLTQALALVIPHVAYLNNTLLYIVHNTTDFQLLDIFYLSVLPHKMQSITCDQCKKEQAKRCTDAVYSCGTT